MNRFFRTTGIYLLVILGILWGVSYFSQAPMEREEISYTVFLQKVENKEIKSVIIDQDQLRGKYVNDKEFKTVSPPIDSSLIPELRASGIEITAESAERSSWWGTLLSSILPILLILGVWFFIMQQSQGGGNRVMNFGKSRAKMQGDDKTKVTFADVAGADEAKQELEEVVDFLKSPKKYSELGAKIPKGILLVGPPGTGKTLLARAVAGEARVPFFTISGSDFVEMFVGVGASRVRDLFEQAKKNAPCIVFIDEIDAVGRHRGAGHGGGHDEREQTLNQLLVEMDGFGANEGIIILAATNRPDILDPALLRPGRFDRHVTVDRPDVKGREEILKVHIKGKPISPIIDLKVLAKQTPGFTGADLSNLVNEAALLSARNNKKIIDMIEMQEAIERVIAGPERKSKVVSEKGRRLTAFHEAGHAIVAHYSSHAKPVHKITIIPRGRAGGYTLTLPKEDSDYMTKNEFLDEIKVFMGGRVAEALVLKDVSTGAGNDLERATEMARQMICDYGMSDVLGPVSLGSRQEQIFLGKGFGRDRNYSEEVAGIIDKEVKTILEAAYTGSQEILSTHMNKLELIAQQLLEIETIDAADFNYLMDENRMPTPEEKKIWIEEKMRESLPNLQAEPESDSPEISEELSGDTEEKLTEN
ncbi:MAG: ATP-dependent zinc metalloprotease FtsH [Negativicutes bacterium]|nr:ATP-dependent zinc metalloprotease FtsH [Negativicutes bacterium]